jgi:hypothetical protein
MGPGYNNETYIIGTEGTLHVGRFAGYPGPIHVEVWQSNGQLHPASKSFDMSYPNGDYPEFLPRFETAYRLAHQQFRDDIEKGRDFAVTQNEILDATVFVEGAHRSSQNAGMPYKLQRTDDLSCYRQVCIDNGLLES